MDIHMHTHKQRGGSTGEKVVNALVKEAKKKGSGLQ